MGNSNEPCGESPEQKYKTDADAPEQKTSTLTRSVSNLYGEDHELAEKSKTWSELIMEEFEGVERGLSTRCRPGWNTQFYLAMVDVRTLAECTPQQVLILREVTEAASLFAHVFVPSEIKRDTVEVEGVRCVWHWPEEFETPAEVPHQMLYIHGGAFCLGSPETHVLLISEIAQKANCAVLAPDYRRCPENPLSNALADVVKAYGYMLAEQKHKAEELKEGDNPKTSEIIVGGESAGGNLAAGLALQIRSGKVDLPQAKALALMSPWADLKDSIEQIRPSWAENEENDFVLGELAKVFARWVLGAQKFGGVHNPDSSDAQKQFADIDQATLLQLASVEEVSPALAPSFKGLPRTLVLTGACETLRDSQLAFVKRLRTDQVAVESEVIADMPHGVGLASFLASSTCPGPEETLTRVAEFMQKVWKCESTESVNTESESKSCVCC